MLADLEAGLGAQKVKDDAKVSGARRMALPLAEVGRPVVRVGAY